MKKVALAVTIGLHIALVIIVTWLTSWFYLGNETTYQDLQNHQLASFLLRLLGSIVLGLFCQLIILLIDFAYNLTQKGKMNKLNIKKVIIISCICNIVSSLAGTIIFFSR